MINLQLFADDAVTEPTGDGQVGDQGSQETTAATETAEETVEPKGEEEESATPKQSKEENSFFRTMRIKAEKEADAKLETRLGEKVAEELKKFKERLAPVLPDGYSDVDEYLSSIDENSTKADLDTAGEATTEAVKKETPAFDEKTIDAIVAKRIEAIPEIKALREKEANDRARLEKDKDDEIVVKSFEDLKVRFPDIKRPEDVPFEVWGLWKEGKSGRNLISCMKEHRYDNDISKARLKGEAVAKGQTNSVAHTGKVATGGGGTTQIEDPIQVPKETFDMMKRNGIPVGKIPDYYRKYHK